MPKRTPTLKKYQAEALDLRDPNNHRENQLILLDAKIPTDENIWNSPDEEETGGTTEEDDNTHYLRCKGCGTLRPVTEFQSCSICGLSYCSACFEAHDCKSPSVHGHPLAHHTALEESRLALKQIYIINETGRLHYLLPVENPQCRILISTRRLMEIALAPHLITPEERQIILTHRELRIKLRQMHPEIKFY